MYANGHTNIAYSNFPTHVQENRRLPYIVIGLIFALLVSVHFLAPDAPRLDVIKPSEATALVDSAPITQITSIPQPTKEERSKETLPSVPQSPETSAAVAAVAAAAAAAAASGTVQPPINPIDPSEHAHAVDFVKSMAEADAQESGKAPAASVAGGGSGSHATSASTSPNTSSAAASGSGGSPTASKPKSSAAAILIAPEEAILTPKGEILVPIRSEKPPVVISSEGGVTPLPSAAVVAAAAAAVAAVAADTKSKADAASTIAAAAAEAAVADAISAGDAIDTPVASVIGAAAARNAVDSLECARTPFVEAVTALVSRRDATAKRPLVLVTGANTLLGHAITLYALGTLRFSVVPVDYLPHIAATHHHSKVHPSKFDARREVLHVDFHNATDVNLLFDKYGPFDYVYHAATEEAAAAKGSFFDRRRSAIGGQLTTMHVVNAAITQKPAARRIVFVSSASVHGPLADARSLPLRETSSHRPATASGIAYSAMELDLRVVSRASGVPFTVFRTHPHGLIGAPGPVPPPDPASDPQANYTQTTAGAYMVNHNLAMALAEALVRYPQALINVTAPAMPASLHDAAKESMRKKGAKEKSAAPPKPAALPIQPATNTSTSSVAASSTSAAPGSAPVSYIELSTQVSASNQVHDPTSSASAAPSTTTTEASQSAAASAAEAKTSTPLPAPSATSAASTAAANQVKAAVAAAISLTRTPPSVPLPAPDPKAPLPSPVVEHIRALKGGSSPAYTYPHRVQIDARTATLTFSHVDNLAPIIAAAPLFGATKNQLFLAALDDHPVSPFELASLISSAVGATENVIMIHEDGQPETEAGFILPKSLPVTQVAQPADRQPKVAPASGSNSAKEPKVSPKPSPSETSQQPLAQSQEESDLPASKIADSLADEIQSLLSDDPKSRARKSRSQVLLQLQQTITASTRSDESASSKKSLSYTFMTPGFAAMEDQIAKASFTTQDKLRCFFNPPPPLPLKAAIQQTVDAMRLMVKEEHLRSAAKSVESIGVPATEALSAASSP